MKVRAIFPFLLLFFALLGGCKSYGPRFDAHEITASSFSHETNWVAPGQSFVSLAATNRIDPAWLKVPTNFFTLGPGDLVDIEVIGDTNSRSASIVGPDGKIYYSILSGTLVWGLTLSQTKETLETGMEKYVKTRPQIDVSLRSSGSKDVWLLGGVNAPGVYPLSTPLTVLGAVSAAKGIAASSTSTEDTVDFDKSFVMRQGELLPVDFYALLRQGDLSQNIYLLPEDFLYFRPAIAKEVYVLGAVAQARPVPYYSSMSLVSAVASAGGPVEYAYLSHVAIVRGSLAHPTIAVVNYKEIVKGKGPDVRLQAGDIIYFPFEPLQKIEQLGEQILRQFVRTIAINEGRNAVTKRAGPAPLSIPLGL